LSRLSGLRDRLAAAAEAFIDPRAAEDEGAFEPDDGAEDPGLQPAPKEGAGNYILVVLDSCRFDTFMEAAPANMLRLGDPQRRWSYASWTGPSHYNLLTGLLPHQSPQRVFASSYYQKEFLRFSQRLGCEVSFKELLPSLWLPTLLRDGLGYRCSAQVSLPVLNPATGMNRSFDQFSLMDSHNDFGAMLSKLQFAEHRPEFHLLNLGETHYPYVCAGQDPGELPHLSGVHGVARRLDEVKERGFGLVEQAEAPSWFKVELLEALRARQVEAVRGVDRLFEQLYDCVPPNTWITVTSDHGELFGEGGYFGHGPIHHDRVWEVPFVEGRIR
tara:strand:+ start:2168 stop:3154 length:987 start_codon:yes stop_codon:yes gene_type:complete